MQDKNTQLSLTELAAIAQETLNKTLREEIDTIGGQFKQAANQLLQCTGENQCSYLDDFLTSEKIISIFRQVEYVEAKNYLQNRGGHLSATDASATCLRQTLFKYFGLQRIDDDKLATFALVRLHSLVGKLIHQFIQSVIPFQFTELPLFIQLHENLIVSGYVDGFYKVKRNGEVYRVVAEIKTAYDTKLTKKFTGDKKHWKQVQFYAFVLSGGLPLSKEHYESRDELKEMLQVFETEVKTPDFIHLIYVDKQLRLSADFLQKVQFQDFRLLEKRVKLLRESIEKLIVPELDWKNFVDTNDCRFCPYESFCKSNPGLILVEDFEEFTYKKPANKDVYLKSPEEEAE